MCTLSSLSKASCIAWFAVKCENFTKGLIPLNTWKADTNFWLWGTVGSVAYIPKHELTSLADIASEKYAATRCADVPKGVESSDISSSILLASSKLSAETASAHCRRRVRRCNPSSSLFCCRVSSFFFSLLVITIAEIGGAAIEVAAPAPAMSADWDWDWVEEELCGCCWGCGGCTEEDGLAWGPPSALLVVVLVGCGGKPPQFK